MPPRPDDDASASAPLVMTTTTTTTAASEDGRELVVASGSLSSSQDSYQPHHHQQQRQRSQNDGHSNPEGGRRRQSCCCCCCDATTGGRSPSSPSSWLLGPTANLCSATLGAGILALPYGFYQSGIVGGVLLLVGLAAGTTVWSIDILMEAAASESAGQLIVLQETSSVENKLLETYEDLVEHFLKRRKWVRRVAEINMLVFCMGCAVAYLVAIDDLLQLLLPTLSKDVMLAIWMSIFCFILVPLSLLPSMKALSYASSISVMSISLLVIHAVVHYYQTDGVNHNDQPRDNPSGIAMEHDYDMIDDDGILPELEMISLTTMLHQNNSGNGTIPNETNATSWHRVLWPADISSVLGVTISLLRACPILIFAYSCQANALPIFNELSTSISAIFGLQPHQQGRDDDEEAGCQEEEEERLFRRIQQDRHERQQQMQRVTRQSVGLCTVLYMIMGVTSVLDFGSHMAPNILFNYHRDAFTAVVIAAMAIAITMAYPLNVVPSRLTLEGLLWSSRTTNAALADIDEEDDDDDDNSNYVVEVVEASMTTPLLEQQQLLLQQEEEAMRREREHHRKQQQQRPNGSQYEQDTDLLTRSNDHDTPSGTALVDDDAYNDALSTCTLQQVVRHVMVTLLITTTTFAMAMIVPNISVVFGLLGGTSSSLLGMILPGWVGKRWILMGGGIAIGVLTTGVTLYSTFWERESS